MKKKLCICALILSLLLVGSCTSSNDVEYSDKAISIFEEIPAETVSNSLEKVRLFDDEDIDTSISDVVVECLFRVDDNHLIIYQYNI